MNNWKFVWNDGKFFSSDKKETIEAYAAGAIKIHGAGCGHIEKIVSNHIMPPTEKPAAD